MGGCLPACDCEVLWISGQGILKRVPGPSASSASLTATASWRRITGRVSLAVGHVFILAKGRPGMCWTGLCARKIKSRTGMSCKRGDWGCELGLGHGRVPRQKRVQLSGYEFGLKVFPESSFRGFESLEREETLSIFEHSTKGEKFHSAGRAQRVLADLALRHTDGEGLVSRGIGVGGLLFF